MHYSVVVSNFMTTCEQRHYTNFQVFWGWKIEARGGKFQGTSTLYETLTSNNYLKITDSKSPVLISIIAIGP